MIVVTGTLELNPEDMEAAVGYVLDAVHATNQEDGCITYGFYRDLENPGQFRIYEEWESEAHLAAHGKAEHMAAFRKKLGTLRVLGRSLKVFDGTNERSL